MNGILKFAQDNNGYVTSHQVAAGGFSTSTLANLVKSGELEKSARGVYVLPYILDDQFYNAAQNNKRGIISLNSALFLFGLSERVPNKISMSFPYGTSSSDIDRNEIEPSFEIDKFFGQGKVEKKSFAGNPLVVYSLERTLCDIVRPKNHIDLQIIAFAYQEYFSMPDRDLHSLAMFANLLHVENTVHKYLEVLS